MARARRTGSKKSASPLEAVANQAEDLARGRFGLQIAGSEYVTEVDGDLAVDAAQLYRLLLSQGTTGNP
ncbi:hypothetical protein LZ318_11860 [Saccharopolyspora indica]|uniref:hypothetical protein n=1 Tax=Saccharopolyspora indica TaxID=1229659 RepID=UPI0022EB9EDB|nr:hypothetical protein [Saccharopolyspora indica]MDA3643793.1 hypothetical protein [Saccharopolyspora indica]